MEALRFSSLGKVLVLQRPGEHPRAQPLSQSDLKVIESPGEARKIPTQTGLEARSQDRSQQVGGLQPQSRVTKQKFKRLLTGEDHSIFLKVKTTF